jgi:hypothetical protein
MVRKPISQLEIYSVISFTIATFTFLLAAPAGKGQQTASPVTKSPDPTTIVQIGVLNRYGELPLTFEANQGQVDARVKFLSRTSGYTLFLTGDEAVLTLRGRLPVTNKARVAKTAHTVQRGAAVPRAGALLMKLRDANPAAKVTGVDELPGTANYFIGNDPAKWRAGIPTYAKVKYEGIYSGIDLVYYGNQRQLEYDFIVAPGVDPRRISFDVRGAKKIQRDEHGELVLNMGDGEIRWRKPVAYQEKDGVRQDVSARYAVGVASRVTFELARYDASRPLYIDPLIYSTYLGGSGGENGLGSGNGIAVDSAGNAYVVGWTQATSFPTMDPIQAANAGSGDAVVSKLNSTGSALIYSTYLGGSENDGASRIAVDSEGNAYVVGWTQSTNFPTVNPFQAANGGAECNCYNAFVAKINPEGSALIYSTYLGGTDNDDFGYGIAVDGGGNAYVAGSALTTDFPVTSGAFQTTAPAGGGFVSKFNSAGSALVYSTYLGGQFSGATGIAVDSEDNTYVTGVTSANFPVTPGAFQTTPGGGTDAFVTKLNPAGSALVYSTFLGGVSSDSGSDIALDSADNAYIIGATQSTNFPTINALQPVYGGNGDAFVTEINPTGSALVYSTYLGGSGYDFGNGIAVDNMGNTYVVGDTSSTNFPTANALQPRNAGNGDAFVAEINAVGSGLVYSTYLGGEYGDGGGEIALDENRNAYLTGSTASPDFPTMNPLQPTLRDVSNAFVAEIAAAPSSSTILTSSLNPSIYGQSVPFTATVTGTGSAPPTGTVSFSWSGNTFGKATLNSSGVATITVSNFNADTFPIVATYKGDTNNLGSTSPVFNQVVNRATSAATLTSSPNPSNVGEAVTFTAAVTSPTVRARGPVTFTAGNTILGTAELGWNNEATISVSLLPAGSTTVTVTYAGDSNIKGSSASVTQVVQ